MAIRQRSANLQQLVANDPQFDAAAFCRRVATAFFKIQDARCAQDLKDARLFVSDGVVERYSLQFAEQRDENYRDQMESVGIDDLEIVDLDSSGIFDEISLRINSHAMRSRQSLCDGARIGGSASEQCSVEIWSFLRLRSAVTDRCKPGLIEGNCPNCGAGLGMNQTAQCPYCRSLLRSGQFDWVLCGVTQFSQWERTGDQSVPGLEQLRQGDPGFSRQALEDRAAVIFWRRVRAERMGKIDLLRKVASELFCKGYASTLKPPREYAGKCALGGVKMMRFIPAREGEALDRIVARIRWSGNLMTVGIDGQRVTGGELFQTNVMVLGRQAGALTDLNRSVTSAHCPHCGAAESQNDVSACPACGTILNAGERDWMLLDWKRFSDPATLSLLTPARTGSLAERERAQTEGLLAWAVKMAAADGKVDPKERALLDRFATHDGCGAGEVERMIAAALSGYFASPEPADATEARDWLNAIIRVAKSDGKVGDEEIPLLRWLGRNANLSEKEIDALVEQMQVEQYGLPRANVEAASQKESKRAGLWLRE